MNTLVKKIKSNKISLIGLMMIVATMLIPTFAFAADIGKANEFLGAPIVKTGIYTAFAVFAFYEFIDFIENFSFSGGMMKKLIKLAIIIFLAFQWTTVLGWFGVRING